MLQYNNDDDSFGERLLDTSCFAHCILKEIHKQPECVTRTLINGGRILISMCVKLGGFEMRASKLFKVHHLVL